MLVLSFLVPEPSRGNVVEILGALFTVFRCKIARGIQKKNEKILKNAQEVQKSIFRFPPQSGRSLGVAICCFEQSSDNPKKTALFMKPCWFVHLPVVSRQPHHRSAAPFQKQVGGRRGFGCTKQ